MNGEGRLRLRVEQLAPRLGEPEANLERMAAAQGEAAREGVELLVTPELSLTGYDLRDRVAALARPLGERPFPALAQGPDLVLGMVELGADFVAYNSAVHLRGGAVLHRHRKLYLPTYGMFDEGRYFGAGDRVRGYDAGGGWRLGLLVCEDLWHPALCYLLALGGAQLVIVQAAAVGRGVEERGARSEEREDGGAGPAAAKATMRFASARAWEQLACAAAFAYGIYLVVASRVGCEGASVFGGGSLIVGPDGRILARGDELAEDRLTADLSLARVAAARRPFSHARDEDPQLVARELARLLEQGA